MGRVYIAGDLKLCESANRDKKIIKNFTKILDKNDTLLLCGIVTKGNLSLTLEILNKIPCKKYIIDYSYDNGIKKIDYIKKNISAFSIDSYIEGKIKDKEEKVIIPKTLFDNKNYDSNFYYAAPESKTGFKEIYKSKTLNLSIDYWDLNPLVYNRIPELIDGFLLFEDMEDTENIIENKKE